MVRGTVIDENRKGVSEHQPPDKLIYGTITNQPYADVNNTLITHARSGDGIEVTGPVWAQELSNPERVELNETS